MPNVRGMAALLVAVLGVALLVRSEWKPRPSKLIPIAAGAVPLALAGYVAPPDTAATYARERAAERYIPRSQAISRTYARGGEQIEFLLISGASRTALHDPRLCLSGSGWRLSDARTERLPGTRVVLQENEAATRSDLPDTSLTYFYVYKGRPISSPTEIRAALLWSALLGRETEPVYFFRFIQPHPADPSQAQSAHARLLDFTAAAWHAVGPTLPAN